MSVKPEFSVLILSKRPSFNMAEVRLYNLDYIKASGRAQLKTGLNAYLIDDQKILERNISFSHSLSKVEKITNRQGFIC